MPRPGLGSSTPKAGGSLLVSSREADVEELTVDYATHEFASRQ
jgi:hypothetical protein